MSRSKTKTKNLETSKLLLTKPFRSFSRNSRPSRRTSPTAGLLLSPCGRVSTKCGCICPVLTRTARLWRNLRLLSTGSRNSTWVSLPLPLVLNSLLQLILTTWRDGSLVRLSLKPRMLLTSKLNSAEVSQSLKKEWQDSEKAPQNSTSSSLVSPMKRKCNGTDPQQPCSTDG